MDNGLKRRDGQKRLPKEVLDVDLPDIAWAITSYVRGNAIVRVSTPKNVKYVRIVTKSGPDVMIRAEHWEKILPLLQDGTFNPLIVPVEAGFKGIDASTRLTSSTTKVNDPLYKRVLFYLSQVFTTTAPTGA